MTPDRHCKTLASTALLFALHCAGPAHSATDAGLSDTDAIAVNEAVTRDDLPAIYQVIFAAIAGAPEQAPAIVDEAARLAPNHRDAIVNTASAAFPEYAEQVAAAGREAATEEERSPWSGEAEIGGLYQTGSNPLDTISASGKLLYQQGNWENEFALSYNYVNDSGETTTRRFVARDETKYSLSERWYTTSRLRFVDYKDDGFQWQTHELVGPGYRIFDTDPGDDADKTDTTAKANLVYGFGSKSN